MISLVFFFYSYVALGAVIGALRGWAKELLVAFSMVLALFVINVLETYVGFVQGFLAQGGPGVEFWTRALIIALLAFFGYQTPSLKRFEGAVRREKLQDSMLGIVLGGVNGYLIVGSLWYYLNRVNYLGWEFIVPPQSLSGPLAEQALSILAILPPAWLGIPAIYFAVAVAFTFVVIVFI